MIALRHWKCKYLRSVGWLVGDRRSRADAGESFIPAFVGEDILDGTGNIHFERFLAQSTLTIPNRSGPTC